MNIEPLVVLPQTHLKSRFVDAKSEWMIFSNFVALLEYIKYMLSPLGQLVITLLGN